MANPYEKYAATTPAPAAAENPYAKYSTPTPEVAPQGVSDALANAFGQGATFNFGDELTAFVRSKLPEFSNWMMKGGRQTAFGSGDAAVPDASTGGQTVATGPNAYEDELAKIRAQTKADEAANPNLMTAANVAGNVAGTVPLLAAAPSALTAVSPSLLVNAAKMAGTGALLGGTAGFGSGEGGLENRAASATIPAIAGGLLGGAMPFAGSVARSVAESAPGRAVSRNVVDPVTSRIAQYLGGGAAEAGGAAESVVQSGALQRLVSAAQRGRFNPQEGQTALNTLGDQAMVADINPALRGQAELANTMQGQTQTLAEQLMGKRSERYLGAPRRMTAALEGNQPPPSAFALRGEGQAFDQNARAVGNQAYGKMAGESLNMSDEMRQMVNIPAVRDALTQIEADAASTGTKLAPIEIMDRVKQKLNDTATAAFASGKPINKADVGNLAKDWESAFWRANPSAQEAAGIYRGAKSLPEFFDAGANALRPAGMTEAGIERSAPAVVDLLQGANPQQIAAGRAGLINAARTQAQEGTKQTRALAEKLLDSEPLQQKFGTLAPDVTPNVLRQARSEQTFAETNKAVREGSPSARRLAQMAEESGGPQIRIDPRNISTRMFEKVGDVLRKVQAPNEAVRDEIGRLLLNPDAPQNRELLQRLAIALQQRQAGTPLRAGAVGAASNQLNQVLQ